VSTTEEQPAVSLPTTAPGTWYARRPRLARRWLGPVITALTVVAILAVQSVATIPGTGSLIALSIAVAAVLGGVFPALVSALIAFVYALVDASNPGTLFVYEPDQIGRLSINLAVYPTMALLVGSIQRRLEVEHERAAERASEDRQRALTETATDAIVTIDSTSTIQAANPAAARMFGWEPAKLVGASLTDLMPQRFQRRHRAAFQRYFDGGVKTIPWQGVELVAKHSSDREFPVEVSFGEYGEGLDRRFTGIIRDISGRKELEAQLLQAQKMEAIGQLAGGVSHDFNNLLTAISGYAELLGSDLPRDDRRQQAVDGIRTASNQATSLTRQLLAFSRRQQLQPAVISLNDVLDRIQPLLRRLLGEDVYLAVRKERDLWPVVADPAQMETMLMNLAINARDAMVGGGTLTIESANVELDDEYRRSHISVVPGQYVMLAVTDTGAGMDPETLNHVFEPFFTTKGVGQGTGLGLATVYGIVNQTGGHVWVYSEVDRGTTFKIYLPRTVGEAESVQIPNARSPVDRGTERILVVEDEEAVRDLILTVLRRQGYEVLSAVNGEAALEVLSEAAGEVDILLTDVVMPGMGGPQLVEEVLRLRPGLPIIYISGYTANSLSPRGLGDDVQLLEKPFTPNGLATAVRSALDRSRSRLS
jgi:PAS domain S-box-containing protein